MPHDNMKLLYANMQSWREWQAGRGVNRNYHILNELRKRKIFDEIIAVDVWAHDYSSGWREMAHMVFRQYNGAEFGGGAMSRMTK